ncbi:MAG: SMP-30/gluconolactonase/LRE family protein [Acidobacteria bacterium]|nr:SMP-30/gluconolactonase/LRE family protein [Acidobacteriota bacterium]
MCICLTAADNKAAKKKAADAAAQPPDLVWPLPPDPPRVRWLAQYLDLARVKKATNRKSSWMDKLTGTKTPDERMDLRKPYGVAADRHGRIYTADTELKSVFVIDPVNHTVERRDGGSRAPLALPVGVAVDPEDRLFVSDADLHAVVCFNPSGQAVAVLGTSALQRPGGIALDAARHRLYVADAKAGRVAVFDTAALKFSAYIGSRSKPHQPDPGTFEGPTNVAVDAKGFLYVADTLNYRVQIFDPAGKFVRMFGAQGDRPGEFIRPKGIAVDTEGHIYVADAEFNNFQILTPEGQPLLAVGSLGDEPGKFALIAGIYIDAEDQIYTTEMFHGRIQVFQYLSRSGAARKKGVNQANNR